VTYFEDPNREAVGVGPIWGGPLRDNDPATPLGGDAEGFDPGEHTVAEVEEYLEQHPDERDAVLELERSGKNRTTLIGGDEA
jgi:hypothetical protein